MENKKVPRKRMHTFSIIRSTCNLYPSHFFSKITDLKCIFISFQTWPSTMRLQRYLVPLSITAT